MSRVLLALCLALSVAACDSDAIDAPLRGEARYLVTLDARWSAETHPDAFPPDPHFSRLTGAAHADGVALWSVGTPASAGLQRVAELGATDGLRAEVTALGDRALYAEGGPVRPSPGTATVEVTVSDARPLATVVSMIAPSPDWFVGVDGLDLREPAPAQAGGGGWVARRVVDLVVYDAGTDAGASYTAADAPAAAVPVADVAYAPLAGTVVGTLTIERVE